MSELEQLVKEHTTHWPNKTVSGEVLISTQEEWRPILNYENLYHVSNKGRVKKVTDSGHYKKGHIMSPVPLRGYLRVNLTKGKQRRGFIIHRLVAEAFCSKPTLNNGLEVNHKNGIKGDNRAENLEWVTHIENIRHGINVLKNDPARVGEKNGMSKLTEAEVLSIRQLYSDGGITYERLAKQFDVSKSAISFILRREHWAHI